MITGEQGGMDIMLISYSGGVSRVRRQKLHDRLDLKKKQKEKKE